MPTDERYKPEPEDGGIFDDGLTAEADAQLDELADSLDDLKWEDRSPEERMQMLAERAEAWGSDD